MYREGTTHLSLFITADTEGAACSNLTEHLCIKPNKLNTQNPLPWGEGSHKAILIHALKSVVIWVKVLTVACLLSHALELAG